MHTTAYKTSKLFFDTYCTSREVDVVEIGSQNVNGSMRDNITTQVRSYTGLDFVEGAGVDVVLTDPYSYPLESSSADVVVTSSCFEHSEMFWLSYLEAMRILKDDGIMYCNVPGSWMGYHRYPVDCWRFYPDAAKALETWGRRNGINCMVLESYMGCPSSDLYVADFVFVMLKDQTHLDKYPVRMTDSLTPQKEYFNGFRFPANDLCPNGWDSPIASQIQDIFVIRQDGHWQYR